jgi:signal transduction histidine kinase
MAPERERTMGRQLELWAAWVRFAAVPWAALEVGLFTHDYPEGYEPAAWVATAALAVGAVAILLLVRRDLPRPALRRLGLAALAFDTAIISAFAVILSFESGAPARSLIYVPVLEAALRYGLRGIVIVPIAIIPILIGVEWWRSEHFDRPFNVDNVTFPGGLQLVIGAIVGQLTDRLRAQSREARRRAAEAEGLRDELGRRADVLDAVNRCARALSSSLDLDHAFAAFIRELQGLVPFARMAVVLVEQGKAQVFAVAGEGADSVFPPGTVRDIPGSAVEDVLGSGQTLYREDISDARYDEEPELLRLGVRSRVMAPLIAGAEPIGTITVTRKEPAAFDPAEIELVSLLGRMVGSAVQNIRAFAAEHRTVEELRRLSALRADFVSMVSHELRSPISSLLGSAETLRGRWRQLEPEQRDSFLALIAHETNRLSALVDDVLDTSRIEAGTFGYSFEDVNLSRLVRDSVEAAERSQDDVRVTARVPDVLPSIRADRDRLRQVLANVLENAVKYSPAGSEVRVDAYTANGRVHVDVSDEGPGVRPEDREVIFEKFGRLNRGSEGKPGTGLGLFIARSIAEAHGGTLDVSSGPWAGARFRLSLPVE